MVKHMLTAPDTYRLAYIASLHFNTLAKSTAQEHDSRAQITVSGVAYFTKSANLQRPGPKPADAVDPVLSFLDKNDPRTPKNCRRRVIWWSLYLAKQFL